MHYTEKLRPKVVPFSRFRHITVYYIHNEKYSPKSYVVNFRTQISSSQSEERTMVFTREKKKKMIRPIRSHRGVWISRQNSRLLMQLAAPLRKHSTRKVLLKEFFWLKKAKNISAIEWNSFVSREDKGDREGIPQYTPYSIGNSSRVIFRIGRKLPRSLRGCFVEVSHD